MNPAPLTNHRDLCGQMCVQALMEKRGCSETDTSECGSDLAPLGQLFVLSSQMELSWKESFPCRMDVQLWYFPKRLHRVTDFTGL